jgi:hypothetical protein
MCLKPKTTFTFYLIVPYVFYWSIKRKDYYLLQETRIKVEGLMEKLGHTCMSFLEKRWVGYRK